MQDFFISFNFAVGIIFSLCYLYQYTFMILPFFVKPKKFEAKKMCKYAVLISARNEENVIGELIKSIGNQTYPQDLIDVFVVADNCTDNTAKVARDSGATVFERFNTEQVGKGYALDFLLDKIGYSSPDCPYDGFFVFDADNVLNKHYIEEMNKTFSNGHKIVTSYRNSKNYGTNWISAGYALWFLRDSKFLNYPRMLCNTSSSISGTGFLVAKDILIKNNGWKFFMLSEDIQFSVHNILEGESIAFCETAKFYDEQPTTFSQSWKQRMRWAKGFLQVSKKYDLKLIAGSFTKSFACFDMFITITSAYLIALINIFVDLIFIIIAIFFGTGADVWVVLKTIGNMFLSIYTMFFIVGTITTFSEWKEIKCVAWKKILYIFTFPIFMITYLPIAVVAIFKDVKWEPIQHSVLKTAEELEQS